MTPDPRTRLMVAAFAVLALVVTFGLLVQQYLVTHGGP